MQGQPRSRLCKKILWSCFCCIHFSIQQHTSQNKQFSFRVGSDFMTMATENFQWTSFKFVEVSRMKCINVDICMYIINDDIYSIVKLISMILLLFIL
jgi:hypothetical protein